MSEHTDELEQLEVPEKPEELSPATMWRTALGRALFGFYVETYRNPYFVNDQYIVTLAEVENRASNNYARLVGWTFLFSLFTIASANNTLGEAAFQGFAISTIPYLTDFCVMVLGVLMMGLVFYILDVFTMTRMRQILFSVTGSETPNMRMVHFKGNNAWVDALTAKNVGYSSGNAHRAIQYFGLIWSMTVPLGAIAVVLVAQIIGAKSVFHQLEWTLGSFIALAGLILSGASVAVLVLVAFVPLRFRLKDRDK